MSWSAPLAVDNALTGCRPPSWAKCLIVVLPSEGFAILRGELLGYVARYVPDLPDPHDQGNERL